jgi:RNA polymerase sigma-70 factor (ECF subfamily)
MATGSSAGITVLLERWHQGEEEARGDELMPLVYDELHRLAVNYFRRERREHTLQPTVLVNELFLKLSEQRSMNWRSRAQFFGVAAQLMRRILVDYARAHYTNKHSGERYGESLKNIAAFGADPDADLLALHRVLNGLEEIDPDQARIVELRFFGGLTVKETAEVMGTSQTTVEREWKLAKAYLKRELVRVLPKDLESEAWRALSAKRLQDAYAEDEEHYSIDLIKEPNTEYESR